jgi:hypothetical protein
LINNQEGKIISTNNSLTSNEIIGNAIGCVLKNESLEQTNINSS